MVVVIIISIVAMLALPVMSKARLDRRAYFDAMALTSMLRSARSRALGRGAAVMVTVATSGGTNPVTGTPNTRGLFFEYELATANANVAPTSAVPYTPFSSCSPCNTIPSGGSCPSPPAAPAPPIAWNLVDWLDFNGSIESDAQILTQANGNPGAAMTVCFTPSGKIFVDSTTATYTGTIGLVTTGLLLRVDVVRGAFATPIGLTRTVVVPPSGIARIISS
jgi:type II secretory pathway pseudopilin PulG